MFQRKYFVTYKVRPNKKSHGKDGAIKLTINGKMEDEREQLKALSVLCRIHRVNPDAIELGGYELLSTEFVPARILRDKAIAAFDYVLGLFARGV